MDEQVIARFSVWRMARRYMPHILLSLAGLAVGIGGWFLPSSDSFLVKLTVIGSFMLAGLWGMVWLTVRIGRQSKWVEAGPEGIRWKRGGRVQEATWDGVRAVYRHELHVLSPGGKPSEWNRRAHVRVVFRDKSEAEFHETLSGFDVLAATIMEYAGRTLLPVKLAELERTGKAKFGPVVVSRDGLAIKGRKRAWGKINYAVNRGYLLIAPNEADFKYDDVSQVALADIPNYIVALNLLGHIGKPPAPKTKVYPKSMWQHV